MRIIHYLNWFIVCLGSMLGFPTQAVTSFLYCFYCKYFNKYEGPPIWIWILTKKTIYIMISNHSNFNSESGFVKQQVLNNTFIFWSDPSMLCSALKVMSQVLSILNIFSSLQTILYQTNLPGLAGLPFIDDPDSALESSVFPFKGCISLLPTFFTTFSVKY